MLLYRRHSPKALAHLDQSLALYDPAAASSSWRHDLAKTSGGDLSFRSLALWMLGYPDAALRKLPIALKSAREIGQAATLLFALSLARASYRYPLRKLRSSKCANQTSCIALADKKVPRSGRSPEC